MTDSSPQFGQWQMEDAPCDFCGAAEADVLLSAPDEIFGRDIRFNVVACRRCGLARTNPRPAAASLIEAYGLCHLPPGHIEEHFVVPTGLLRWALENYRGYPPMGRAEARPTSERHPPAVPSAGGPMPAPLRLLLAPLASVVLSHRKAATYPPYNGDGRLLDFGCGAGGYVARAAAAGWTAEGLDLSPDTLEAGRAIDLSLQLGTLPGTDLPPESFDTVTAWGSLEHVTSPLATLKAIHAALRPGGQLLLSVPRLDGAAAGWFGPAWYPLGLPLHLTHFTRETLARHLEAAGFRAERFVSRRSAAYVRQSFSYLARHRGGRLCRSLARSRLVAGLLSYWALATGRSCMMIVLAKRV